MCQRTPEFGQKESLSPQGAPVSSSEPGAIGVASNSVHAKREKRDLAAL
jgi:hypothetical protein